MVVFCLAGSISFSQKADSTTIFTQNMHNVSIGYDFGKLRTGGSGFGPMFFKYEYRLFKQLGVGGTVYAYADKSNSYQELWPYSIGQIGPLETDTYIRGFALMPRANWHFIPANAENSRLLKWDIYAGLSLGYGFEREIIDVTYLEEFDTSYEPTIEDSNEGNHFMAVELNVGARYYPIDNFGIYCELGYGISTLQAGLTYTF